MSQYVDEIRVSADGPDLRLARELSALAREMRRQEDARQLMQVVVHAAVRDIPAAEQAGIMLMQRGNAATQAATGDVVERLDQLQRASGGGPCLRALREQRPVRANDLANDDRWPSFGAAASALGIKSMLSLQLCVEDGTAGALNLYAQRPDAFTPADEELGLLLASHAALALSDARRIENLQLAIHNRDVIGQAKGILMERFKVSSEQAFFMLVTASQRTHRKLHQVADHLSVTGELP